MREGFNFYASELESLLVGLSLTEADDAGVAPHVEGQRQATQKWQQKQDPCMCQGAQREGFPARTLLVSHCSSRVGFMRRMPKMEVILYKLILLDVKDGQWKKYEVGDENKVHLNNS